MSKAQRAAEAADLGKWCLCVAQYLATLHSDRSLSALLDTIKLSINAGSVTQLRSIKRDLTEWGRGLSTEQQRGLEAVLQSQMGIGFSATLSTDLQAVNAILERGEIQTEEEYRLLSQWMDRVLDDEAEPSLIARVDDLLTRFGVRSS